MRGAEVEIPMPPAAAMPAYAAVPAGATRGVVVLHEVFGRQPEIDRVVERFAEAGYAACTPDLFADGLRSVCITRALWTIATGKGSELTKIAAAQSWLCAAAGLDTDHVGVVGFCIGGGLALVAGPRFAAVSTNYGDVPKAEFLRGSPPTIGCYGGRDRAYGGNGPRLQKRLESLGVIHEVHTYAEVGHSFLTDGDHPVLYALGRPLFQIRWNPEVAEQGWAKIMAFLDEHL